VLAVGPEGGFSPEELARFAAAGFKPLVIGNTILRTETASLYAAAAVRVILLENTTWTLTTP
jgi:16S rRNA (uracil1498-N3)-methyltransferase